MKFGTIVRINFNKSNNHMTWLYDLYISIGKYSLTMVLKPLPKRRGYPYCIIECMKRDPFKKYFNWHSDFIVIRNIYKWLRQPSGLVETKW